MPSSLYTVPAIERPKNQFVVFPLFIHCSVLPDSQTSSDPPEASLSITSRWSSVCDPPLASTSRLLADPLRVVRRLSKLLAAPCSVSAPLTDWRPSGSKKRVSAELTVFVRLLNTVFPLSVCDVLSSVTVPERAVNPPWLIQLPLSVTARSELLTSSVPA